MSKKRLILIICFHKVTFVRKHKKLKMSYWLCLIGIVLLYYLSSLLPLIEFDHTIEPPLKVAVEFYKRQHVDYHKAEGEVYVFILEALTKNRNVEGKDLNNFRTYEFKTGNYNFEDIPFFMGVLAVFRGSNIKEIRRYKYVNDNTVYHKIRTCDFVI